MGNNRRRPCQLRQLMAISFVITILLLILWVRVYRLDMSLRFSVQYHRPTDEIAVKLPPPRGPTEEKVSLIRVNETKTVLVSAYQEHRTSKKEVRHVKDANEFIHPQCDAAIGGHFLHDQLLFKNNLLGADLQHLYHEKICHRFLEVKNQEAKSDSFPYNFTVCISAMYDFTNVLQLVQSLEMLQLLGVERVVIYKTSCSNETQRVLDYYTEKGLVEVIPWSWSRFLKVSRKSLPFLDPGDLHYYGQIPALNDCVYRYMYRSRYVALHDIDELILPQSVNSWSELLPLLEGRYGADKCYIFRNNVFPTTVTRPPPASQSLPTHWQNVSGVNILAHLYQEPIIKETEYMQFKIIVNPRAVFSTSVHGVLESQKGCSWVDRTIARMYHTRVPAQPKLTPEQLIYDGRLLNYSDRFIPAVNTVLRESGLLPEDNSH